MIAKFVVQALVALCLLVLCESRTITINSNSALGMEYYLCNDTNMLESNMTMELSSGIHYLPEGPMCKIENLTNLTIRGVDGSGEPSLVICQGDHDIVLRGFLFLNVTNLLIENILITNCGTAIPNDILPLTTNSYAYFGPGQKAVFLFSHCTNLHLEGLTIDRSFGLGIVGLNLMGATELSRIAIQNTDSSRHVLCQGIISQDLSCSGSGAVFVYTDNPLTTAFGANTTLNISKSLIMNNTNTIPFQYFLPQILSLRAPFQTTPTLISGASGLEVLTGQLEYHVQVHMANLTLTNNVGEIGGMLLLQYNSVRNTNYYIEGVFMSNNVARGLGRGGAILVAVIVFLDRLDTFPEYPEDIYDLIQIRDSSFHRNVADQGGAVYFHVTPQNITEYRFTITNATFTDNVAYSGSAFESAAIRSVLVPKFMHILLQDIEAYDNRFQQGLSFGSGTIENSHAVFTFSQIYNVTITGKHDRGSRFYNNSPGAVLVSGGNVFLCGYVTFEDNFGFNGGALSLYDETILFICEGSTLRFARNRALRSGGAIYANSLITGIANSCVIQIIGPSRIFSPSEADLLNLDIQFINNTAGEAGNSIHANPVYNCGNLPEASFSFTIISEDQRRNYDAIFNFASTVDNGVKEFTSIPIRLCTCNQTELLCDEMLEVIPLTTVPGKSIVLHLAAIDLVRTPVASFVYAEIIGDPTIQLGPTQYTRQITGTDCTKLDFNLYSTDNTNTLVNLYATPGGLPVTLNVTVESCPPGFQLESINRLLQCTCDDFITDQIETTCDETRFTVLRPENTWIGVDSSTKDISYVSLCPIQYCNEGISEVNLSIPDQLCENGRSGILCGKCTAPLSVVFGSAKCSDCSSLWLLTIPLYAIAGVLLVFLLFLLDLTVTKGTINGLILYANLISVNANIFFRGAGQGFLFVFISLLNLELGFPVCFYDGMNDAAKTGFQFVFPAYLMVLCGGIIYLSRWSRIMQKMCSSSGVQVLATLIYLSYARILRTAIDMLSFATLRSENNHHPIWLFDGNINYFEGIHVFYFVVAIVVILAFVLPYSFSLILIALIQRIPYVIPRLKPLIDAYLGPFKDRWRHWFGLRLLLLGIVNIIYATLGTDNPELALLLQLLFIIGFALYQAYVQPYKNMAIELLDLSFIANFIILTLASSYIISESYGKDDQKAVVSLMASISFVVFFGIISYHGVVQIQKTGILRQGRDRIMSQLKQTDPAEEGSTDDMQTSAYVNVNKVGTSNITELSLRTAIPAPDEYCSSSRLREPVMDFS